MPVELYRLHRPATYREVIGQPEAVKVLTRMTQTHKIPHSILFTGPSGVGKTTLARILQSKLECHDQDFKEVNASDSSGIDMIREIRNKYSKYPVAGKVRMYLIDECHGLTGAAQNAFLKMLEDTPEHVYFILATTDPGKVIPTIKTRCTEIALKPLTPTAMKEVVTSVAKKAGVKLSEELTDALISKAGGSARQALVDLSMVAELKTDDERLGALAPAAVTVTANAIINGLMPFKGRPDWNTTAQAINSCEEDLERVRQYVLACAARQLVSGGKTANRAYLIVAAFAEPFFHSRKAGMLAAAWEVFNTK